MHYNTIGKWFMGVLLIIVCCVPSVTLAADIPPKDGYIQDTAQVLTNSEIDELQQAIDNASFSLYVYTIDNLGGSTISDLGSDVFSEWSLGSQDALLIIAMEERKVHLEVLTGSPLDKAITQAPEFRNSANTYTQFIDDYFVPYAAEGDFHQGILSVVTQLDVLKEQLGSPTTSPSAPTETVKKNSINTTLVFIIILIVIIVAVALFRWYRRLSINRGKKELKRELEIALGRINQIEQDIEPMVQLSKGESETYLKSIEERFYVLLQASTEFSNQLDAFVVPMWVTNSTTKTLQSLQQNTQAYTASSTEILSSLNEYKAMESQTTKVLEQSLEGWSQSDQQLQAQAKALGYPLDELLARSASIQGVLNRSKESIEFDPMQVKVLLEHVPEKIAQLTTDIELVNVQKSALEQLPEQLQSTKKKLDQLIKDEKLTLVEIKPYAFYDQVDEQMNQLSQLILIGNTSGAATILLRINGWMEEAVEQITSSVRARDWNTSAIETVSERLAEYQDSSIHELEQKLQEINQLYDTEHWRHVPEQIEQIRTKRMQIDQLLPTTRSYNELDTQRYLEAERNLKIMIEQLVEMDTASQLISSLKSELDRSYEQQVQAINLVEMRYAACKSSMGQNGILSDERLLLLDQAAEQSIHTLDRVVLDTPRNLTKLILHIQNESMIVQQLEEAVQAAIDAKRAAELALQQERARRRRMNDTFGGGGGGFGGGGSGSSGGGSGWKSGGSRGGGSSFSSKSKGGSSSWGSSGKSRGGGSKW